MQRTDESFVLNNYSGAFENGFIKPFFQPIIRTLTHELCAAETLARWDDPLHGVISPADFIGTFEKHGIIYELDMKMVESVCRCYRDMVRRGVSPMPFSVNLSRLDFAHNDLFEKITGILDKYEVPSSAVHIEITESIMLDNTYLFKKIFDRFRAAGFEMWLDDFGSGYTSLNVLKEYEFDVIKIDMRFLSSMSARSKKIISAVVNMAKSLGCHTLAEGVETEEQLEFLREIGCEMLQGYYFAKPMSEDSFYDFIGKQTFITESVEKRGYVNTVGLINLLSSDPIIGFDNDIYKAEEEQEVGSCYPLALLEYENERFSFVYTNKAYTVQLTYLGFADANDAENQINDRTKPFYSGTVSQMTGCIETGRQLRRNYVLGDNYYSLTMRYLASTERKTMLALNLNVFLKDGIEDRYAEISRYGNALFRNFDLVNIIDPDKDTSKQLYSKVDFDTAYGFYPLRNGIKIFADKEVFNDDKKRYLDFMDMDTLKQRISESDSSFIMHIFRLKACASEKGYPWRLIKITAIPSAGETIYMYTMQQIPESDIDSLKRMLTEE